MIPSFVTADPRSAGLVRPVGSTALYITGGAIVPLFKFGTGGTDWCTVPQGGSATPTTSDPRSAGRSGAVGTVVMYVSSQVGLLLRKFGAGATDWATVPVIAGGGGGGTLADGDYGDVTVSASGTAIAIDAGAVTTAKMGGDVTAAGKALLDDATAADQRTTLGLGTAATNSAASFEATGNVAAHASNTSGVHGISAFAATLLDDPDAATARATLGAASADPWTYVVLGSDFTSSLTANTAVTGFAFAPAANSTYVVEGFFMMRTATASSGGRPGLSWPTGTTDGAAQVTSTSSVTASAFGNRGTGATFNAPSSGFPNTTESWPGSLWATVVTGASPSGNVQVTLASETAAINVTMRAGSWIRYRTI